MLSNVDPDLLACFVDEATGYLPPMRAALPGCAAGDPAARELVLRHAHSLKGSAALVGFDDLGRLGGRLEDLCDDVLAGRLAWTETVQVVVEESVSLLELYVAGLTGEAFDPAELSAAADQLYNELPSRSGASEKPAAPPTVAAVESDAPADDEVPPELLEVFALEADEHLRTIAATLPQVKDEPANKELLQVVRRSAHTLKGAAGMVGFGSITRLAHRMEDVLDHLYESTAAVSDTVLSLLFRTADALGDLAAGTADASGHKGLFAEYDLAMKALQATAGVAAVPREVTADDAEVAARMAAAARRSSQFVRVPIERLDELTKLVSELVIARTGFELKMADYARLVDEVRLTSGRLTRCSNKLETEYEARALGGRSSFAGAGRMAFAGGGGGGGSAPVAYRDHGFDDLEFDRYTEFHLLSRELSEATTDVQTVGNELAVVHGDLDGLLTRKARLTSEVQDKLMRVRMLPLATIATQLHRTVRTVAAGRGKQAVLVTEGEATELDKTVLEEMAESLLHLLRNAVDHGLEAPAARERTGKPARGTVRLHAFQEGAQVVLRVSDDGAGIDPAAVRDKAVSQGLVSAREAEGLGADELARFLFVPGFSTAREVTDISGRGVGLDVVQAKVRKLKGTIAVASEPGRGTTFTIRLPLTLAVTRALLVKANGQTFAVPLQAVEQILRPDGEPDVVGGNPVLRVGDALVPLVPLAAVLGLPPVADEAVARPPVLVLNAGDGRVGLVVDKVLGGREVVVKSLGTHVRANRGVGGATVLGDGTVVLILNPNELSASGGRQPPEVSRLPVASRSHQGADAPRSPRVLTVMVVDDSPSVRRVVSNLVKAAGWADVPAKDGLDALERLQAGGPPPDVILSDIEMPRMDGYELLAALKRQPALRHVPVVMITSRAGEKHRRKAAELGAAAYVVKPYQDEALLQTIRGLVGVSR